METEFIPRGVCSRKFNITLENGVVEKLEVLGGCNGNLQGISSLVKGQKAEDVIGRLKGIRCGGKPTSCPDQIAIALEKALEEERGKAE